MQNVLADLCLDSEAATTTALRLARAFDEGDHAFRRLATAVAKYWVCKATPPLVAEALECLGGNYVEESGLPRLFRESPLNSIWEVGERQLPRCAARARAGPEPGGVPRRARARPWCQPTSTLPSRSGSTEALGPDDAEARGRTSRGRMALRLQGSLLVRHAPSEVADAFCAARLGDEAGAPAARSRAASTRPRSWNVTARGSEVASWACVEIFYCPV